MANHKSSEKRIRQTETRRLRNRYKVTKMRMLIKQVRLTTSKTEGEKLIPEVQKVIDKVAKNHIIHKNKAANLKSSLVKHINSLAA